MLFRIALVSLFLAACGDKSPPPKSPEVAPTTEVATAEPVTPEAPAETSAGDAVIAMFAGFKDQTCACADAACIEKVEQAMMDWAMKNMETLKDLKPTREQDERADQLEAEMDACKARVSP